MECRPGGFPESGVGIELRILEKLFSPEEAELAMTLKEEPEEVSSIAHRTQANETELAEKLENMAQKGLIFRTKRQGQPYYQAFQFLVGIYEFQLKNLDHEFSELFEQYLPYYGLGMAKVKTGQLRKIPIESALENLTGVAPYNKVRELLKGKDLLLLLLPWLEIC